MKPETSLKLLKAPLKTSKAAVSLRWLGRGLGCFGLKRTPSSSRIAPNNLQTWKVRKKSSIGEIKGSVTFPINSIISLHCVLFLGIPMFQQLHYCSVYLQYRRVYLQCRSIAAYILLHHHCIAPSRTKNNTCSDCAPLSLNVWEFFCNYKCLMMALMPPVRCHWSTSWSKFIEVIVRIRYTQFLIGLIL